MLNRRLNRRQLLRGLGGFTLAMPFLPSIAKAQQAAPRRRFIAMTTAHGGIWGRNMYPGADTLDQRQDYAGHTIRAGRLQAGAISPVLSAAGLDRSLVGKMNVLRGLDIPYYIAHHAGGHLGNFAANDGNGSEGAFLHRHATPTIDQVMAYSRAVYPDLDTIRQRTIVVGTRGMSWNWSRPADRSGHVQPMASQPDPTSLFNRMFRPGEDDSQPTPLVVDRVHADYRRLMESNRRISVSDRRRLTEHMDRLFELQRRLSIDVQCAGPDTNRPEGDDWGDARAQVDRWTYLVDIITAAIGCDLSRLAVLGAYNTFSDYIGDWHQEVAHQGHTMAMQPVLVESHQRTFEHVFLRLARNLDAIEEPGGTALDNTLLMWSQESGMLTHDSYAIPVVTAGSAGGNLRTGLYVDYRNQDEGWNLDEDGGAIGEPNRPGLYYNQWLGTALTAMGVDAGEYQAYSRDLTGDYGGERPGGYGPIFASDGTRRHYGQAWHRLSDGLPFIS